MGWSDISISLSGPIVHSLIDHFSDRWNFIFDEKYTSKDPGKYEKVASSTGVKLTSEADGQLRGGLGGFENRFNRGIRRFVGEGEEEERREEGGDRGESGGGSASIQLCRR